MSISNETLPHNNSSRTLGIQIYVILSPIKTIKNCTHVSMKQSAIVYSGGKVAYGALKKSCFN